MNTQLGIIGCGNISAIYLHNFREFGSTVVRAVADLDRDRAAARAEEFDVPEVRTVEEMLADPDIEVVVNLTVPKAHAEISRAVLEAGKHVYAEKPLATERVEGEELMRLAEERGLRVGCAPDTFLGAGLQTCRKLIDEGVIGRPVAVEGFMLCRGHESWHPSPEFYYEVGGGPMLDMGPYYLTAMVHLLGPIRSVCGMTSISFPTRTITSEPKRGKVIQVETPTHVVGVFEFESGAVGSLTTSFDVWPFPMPSLVVYGEEGTLQVPDPNGFGGPVRLRRGLNPEFEEVPLSHPHASNRRGLGLLEMTRAMAEGRPHRASGELALHVLDAMLAVLESGAEKRHVAMRHGARQPAALAPDELTFASRT